MEHESKLYQQLYCPLARPILYVSLVDQTLTMFWIDVAMDHQGYHLNYKMVSGSNLKIENKDSESFSMLIVQLF